MDVSFYQEGIVPYVLGVSESALIGALTGWGQKRDADRESAERAAEEGRERIKPLIQRIEQKPLRLPWSISLSRSIATKALGATVGWLFSNAFSP